MATFYQLGARGSYLHVGGTAQAFSKRIFAKKKNAENYKEQWLAFLEDTCHVLPFAPGAKVTIHELVVAD